MSLFTDPDQLRKTVAGVSLVGFPLAGFVSCLTDSNEGTGQSGQVLYDIVQSNATGIGTTALVFMVSAMLTAPAALGLAHVLRRRGVIVGTLGAICLAAGAFGHFGYGLWQLMLSRAVGPGDPAGVIAYLDRTSSAVNILLPLLFLIDIGVLLLAIGLLRARVVAAWAPWLVIAGVAADLVVQFVTTASWPVTALWGLLTIAFGYVGIRLIAMPLAAWREYAQPAVAADSPAHASLSTVDAR